MKNIFKSLAVLVAVGMLFCTSTQGQGILQTKGKAIVDAWGDTIILRGMGLGGWMLQEGYMLQTASFANAQHKIKNEIEELIGKPDMEAFYDAWLANHVRKIDIDSLKSWGFNSVRLPMHYNLFTLPIEDEPVPGQHTWLNKGFELTDTLISWCRQNQMYVVLDLHAAPGGQGYDEGISDYDPSKPSLWESKANRDKTVALWKKLAERYADEPWVAGYDLLNEPNWNLPGGVLLRSLYEEITDSIRTVDEKHLLFIEGNWFANDFTGLTPPWDDNMVYSPHKYWSFNDQASIQWVLDMRNTYDIPLYLGESGENSNVWFRDAIRLLEDFEIGWAWWPMKKVESIAGPLSVVKSDEYQTLLDYWNGSGPKPSVAFAKAALMDLTEKLKMENCIQQKDVRDAMFRQVYDNTTKPFRIQSVPGVVYATDFSMGTQGIAYFDTDIANYNVSTGNFTAWNNGWAYRNDGVDIETCSDNINTNGYNVGWLNVGEWMKYDISVDSAAVYDIEVRAATPSFEGRFHFGSGGSDISGKKFVPSSGGYQTWQTITVEDVVLTPENKDLYFYSDGSDYNLSSFKFVAKGPSTDLPTEFLSGITADRKRIQVNINKPLQTPFNGSMADFVVEVNGSSTQINSLDIDADNPRIIYLALDEGLVAEDEIQVTYSGNNIQGFDATPLFSFTQEEVENNLPIIHQLPGKIEVEEYFFQVGTSTENTFDAGGGKNVGNLDQGDYMDYMVEVPFGGIYELTYRTAAPSEEGGVQIQRVDSNGNITNIHSATFDPTGDWQTWASTTKIVNMPQGMYQMRVSITQSLFNLNWLEFNLITSTEAELFSRPLKVFPNPSKGLIQVKGRLEELQKLNLRLTDMAGKTIVQKELGAGYEVNESLDISDYPLGLYFIQIDLGNGKRITRKIVKN